jgi:putative ABC transport system ATP-binding protein
MGEGSIHALNDIDLKIASGDFLSIMGPSGSGKSTLMNIIGLLDQPDQGKYLINGDSVDSLDDDTRSEIRNRTIGFIFQNFNLLPRVTALRNVMLPLIYRTMPISERIELAEITLKKVGLEDRIHHHPNQLSGGERQRVAIARALAGSPSVILADEPTGNLDSKTGAQIMKLLEKLSNEGQTVIMVTHDEEIATTADKIIRMRDGKII